MGLSLTSEAHSKGKRILIGVGVLLGMQVLFILINTLAALLPAELMQQHLTEWLGSSLLDLAGKFDWHRKWFGSLVCFDNNPFICAAAMQQNAGDPFTTWITSEFAYLTPDGETVGSYSYARYWHGWRLFTCLFMALGSIELFQAFLLVLTLAVILALLIELKRRLGWAPAVLIVLIAFFSTDIAGNFNGDLLLALSVFSTLAICPIILHISARHAHISCFKIGLLVMVAGAWFNFIDFLTIPGFVSGLIVFCALLASNVGDMRWSERFKLLIGYFVLFGIGYLFTWVTKWALMLVVMGPAETANAVLGEMQMWTLSDADKLGDGHILMLYEAVPHLYPIIASACVVLAGLDNGAISINVAGLASFIVTVALMIAAFVKARRNREHATGRGKLALFVCLPCLIVLVFMVVMSVHASCHLSVFTYKNWALVMALAAGMSVWYMQNNPRYGLTPRPCSHPRSHPCPRQTEDVDKSS